MNEGNDSGNLTTETRRKFLATSGVMIGTGLAGCSSGGSGDSTDASSDGGDASNQESEPSTESPTSTEAAGSSDVFESIEFEGRTLVVQITESTDVDSVNIINDDGSQWGSQSVGGGVTRLEFDTEATLRTSLEFVALRGDEEVESVTESFQPNLVVDTIETVATKEGYQSINDDTGSGFNQLVASVSNEGNSSILLFTASPEFNVLDSGVMTAGIPQPIDLSSEPEPTFESELVPISPGETRSIELGGQLFIEASTQEVPLDSEEFTTDVNLDNEEFRSEEPAELQNWYQGSTHESELVLFDTSEGAMVYSATMEYTGGPVKSGEFGVTTRWLPYRVESDGAVTRNSEQGSGE